MCTSHDLTFRNIAEYYLLLVIVEKVFVGVFTDVFLVGQSPQVRMSRAILLHLKSLELAENENMREKQLKVTPVHIQ